jgi:hypothetical protein
VTVLAADVVQTPRREVLALDLRTGAADDANAKLGISRKLGDDIDQKLAIGLDGLALRCLMRQGVDAKLQLGDLGAPAFPLFGDHRAMNIARKFIASGKRGAEVRPNFPRARTSTG